MKEEIIDVTPEKALTPEEAKTIAKEKTGNSAKNVARQAGVALGAAVVGAGIAEGMHVVDAEAVVEEAVEVAETEEYSSVAGVFGRAADAEVMPHAVGQVDGHRAQSAGEADDVTPVAPDDAEVEIEVDEMTPAADTDTGEVEVPDFIEQPEMDHIDVHIDESLDMDA